MEVRGAGDMGGWEVRERLTEIEFDLRVSKVLPNVHDKCFYCEDDPC